MKCITFDKKAYDAIPKAIRERMEADMLEAKDKLKASCVHPYEKVEVVGEELF